MELREEAAEAEGWLGLEGQQDLAVKRWDREVWIGEIDDAVDVAV